MMHFLGSYAGVWGTAAIVVVVGVLVTQGILDGKFADIALGFITGGAFGGAVGLKAKTPGDDTQV